MKTARVMVLVALVTVRASVQGQAQQAAQGEAPRPASNAKVLKRAEIDALLAQPATVLVIDVRRTFCRRTASTWPVPPVHRTTKPRAGYS